MRTKSSRTHVLNTSRESQKGGTTSDAIYVISKELEEELEENSLWREPCIPRKVILIHHLECEMHKKAVEAEKISHFSSPEKVGKTQLGSVISKSNARLKNKVAGLMINVFNDSKKLTLSAWSWPSREDANMMSVAVDVTQDFETLTLLIQHLTNIKHFPC